MESGIIAFCVFFSSYEVMILVGELMFCKNWPFRKYGKAGIWLGGSLFIGIPLLWKLLREEQISFFFAEFFRIGDWFYYGYLLFFLLSLLLIWSCFEIDAWQALFYGNTAYIVQHLRYGCVELLTFLFFEGNRSSWQASLISLTSAVILYLFSYFFLVRWVQKREDIMVDNRQLLLFTCFSIIMVNVVNLYLTEYNLRNEVVCFYIVVVCVLLLVIQFGLFERKKILCDKQFVEGLLLSIDKQRQYSEENIQLINHKCHDLKHQISAMRNMDLHQRDHSIDELEKAVMFYESDYKTGNVTLDAVLTEKSMLCRQRNIEFTCIVEGTSLDFMEPVDLYSLLGNGLDNAIEAIEREPPTTYRMITLNIARNNKLVSICIINVCTLPQRFVNNLPVTCKPERGIHGIGTKSMLYITEKYGGSLQMLQKEGVFEVDMLIPIKE